MGSSQRTVPQKVLFGNVIDNVLHSAPCDVIIFSYTSEMRPISYGKILVPTAGYKHSQRAMQIAVTLEKKFGGHITTIFVGRESETNLADDIMHKVKTYADMFGIPVDVLFQLGNVPEKIVDTAKKGDFSLVIIGSTERPHYYKVLLGSVADEIVNRAPCNVLVVRTKGR
jgi:nucleotide-binding universal stress UspA family protein